MFKFLKHKNIHVEINRNKCVIEKQIDTEGSVDKECDICYENSDTFHLCDVCSNGVCSECREDIHRCPFCRSSYKLNTVITFFKKDDNIFFRLSFNNEWYFKFITVLIQLQSKARLTTPRLTMRRQISPYEYVEISNNLIVTANSINFLLISDGSSVLRYST
jgi:hypothetical protein